MNSDSKPQSKEEVEHRFSTLDRLCQNMWKILAEHDMHGSREECLRRASE
jgi:hypothetical protein